MEIIQPTKNYGFVILPDVPDIDFEAIYSLPDHLLAIILKKGRTLLAMDLSSRRLHKLIHNVLGKVMDRPKIWADDMSIVGYENDHEMAEKVAVFFGEKYIQSVLPEELPTYVSMGVCTVR